MTRKEHIWNVFWRKERESGKPLVDLVILLSYSYVAPQWTCDRDTGMVILWWWYLDGDTVMVILGWWYWDDDTKHCDDSVHDDTSVMMILLSYKLCCSCDSEQLTRSLFIIMINWSNNHDSVKLLKPSRLRKIFCHVLNQFQSSRATSLPPSNKLIFWVDFPSEMADLYLYIYILYIYTL